MARRTSLPATSRVSTSAQVFSWRRFRVPVLKKEISQLHNGERFRLGGAEFVRKYDATGRGGFFGAGFTPADGDIDGFFHILYGAQVVEVVRPEPVFEAGRIYLVRGRESFSPSQWYCHYAGPGLLSLFFTSQS